MDHNLVLTLVGVFLGIIGAWPTLREWVLSARSKYSQSAERRQAALRKDYVLTTRNPHFLVSFVAFHGALATGFVVLTFMLSSASLKSGPLYLLVLAAKLICSLVAGFNLGKLLGITSSIMRKIRAESENAG